MLSSDGSNYDLLTLATLKISNLIRIGNEATFHFAGFEKSGILQSLL